MLRSHQGEVKRVHFSPYGRMLATTSGDATVRIFDTRTFEFITALRGHTCATLEAAAWSSRGP